jgi:hypothetical protein
MQMYTYQHLMSTHVPTEHGNRIIRNPLIELFCRAFSTQIFGSYSWGSGARTSHLHTQAHSIMASPFNGNGSFVKGYNRNYTDRD